MEPMTPVGGPTPPPVPISPAPGPPRSGSAAAKVAGAVAALALLFGVAYAAMGAAELPSATDAATSAADVDVPTEIVAAPSGESGTVPGTAPDPDVGAAPVEPTTTAAPSTTAAPTSTLAPPPTDDAPLCAAAHRVEDLASIATDQPDAQTWDEFHAWLQRAASRRSEVVAAYQALADAVPVEWQEEAGELVDRTDALFTFFGSIDRPEQLQEQMAEFSSSADRAEVLGDQIDAQLIEPRCGFTTSWGD